MAVPPPHLAARNGMIPRTKADLRLRMRALRAAFAPSAPLIMPPDAFLAKIAPGVRIAAYCPMPDEADPGLLIEAAVQRGGEIALPRITRRDEPMQFLAWKPGDPLISGPFGLLQPDAGAVAIAPDLILAPLLAVNHRFHRLGQGAGYYDRAFAAHPHALRIGIAWSIQRIEDVAVDLSPVDSWPIDSWPIDSWDVALHAMIDENGWHEAERIA